jgi:amino acid adenylation domain-containing protein
MTQFQGSSLTTFLTHAAKTRPQAEAILCGSESLTFQRLANVATKMADQLIAAGLAPGDRLFLFASNSIEFCVAFWACQFAGGVVVPVHPDTKSDKLAWMIDDSTPQLIVSDADRLDRAHTASVAATHFAKVIAVRSDVCDNVDDIEVAEYDVRAGGEDLAAIIYTSGSTSNPKGVMLSHKNMVAAATSVSTYLSYNDQDRVYCAVPFTFDYGLHQITMTARVGATLIVGRDFSQPIMNLNTIATTHATVVPLVPSMAALILPFQGRFDLSAVRAITNTAAALGEKLITDLQGFFASAEVFSMYGLTECHRCTYLEPSELSNRRLSVGKAIPFTEMWVLDESGARHDANATGELVIRGETVMQGYWKNEKATNSRLKRDPVSGELVLHTGDQVRLDAEGFAYFVGRGDDILKIRGIKVAPVAVENKLAAHPDIAQVAVLATPCPIAGARLTAFVETTRKSTLTSEALLKWCQSRFENHDRPSACHIMSTLPKNQNGKIDRLILGASLTAELETVPA